MRDDPDHIVAWQRLGPDVTTSGRLTAADVDELGALGIRSVINLALMDSPGALAGEAELLEGRGMAYTHIPVPFGAPEDNHFAAFCTALQESQHPVHVHCIMNWRVSAFFYRYHRDVVGMEEPEARALMEQQWSPWSSSHADAPAWVQFVEGHATLRS